MTKTSVQVTGRHFPARMKNGTPCQRHDWISRRSAANVATFDSGNTPGSRRYPRNWPRTVFAVSSAGIAFRTFTFSSRSLSASRAQGGSIATFASTCKR